MAKSFSVKSTTANFRQTLIYMFSILAVALIVISVTLAWFSSEDNGDGNKQFADFDIEYQVNMPTGIIVPDCKYENNCATVVSGKTGTTDAYIRAKIVFTLEGEANDTILEPIIIFSDTATGKTLWIYNETDKYYYYVGYINETLSAEFIHGYKSKDFGNNVDISTLDVKITVEAIQREYQAYLDKWPTASTAWKTAISEYDVTKDNEWD